MVIEPRLFSDERGYFFESFNAREFGDRAGKAVFVQDYEFRAAYGTMSGLHFYCPPFSQGRLVRCIEGNMLHVAVDVRKGSPTYCRHVAVELSGANHRQLFIPRGFAHGFAVLSATAVCQCRCDNYSRPESEGGLSMLDGSLGIDWRIPAADAIISEKDRALPLFENFYSPFNVDMGLY